jgi:hypothetical protein
LKLALIAVAIAAAPLLTGCAKGAVHVSPPALTPDLQERCSHLGNRLPHSLESLTPRVISPVTPFVHAWGSPAVILTCGVPVPSTYSPRSSETTEVNGVRWFEQPGSDAVVWTGLLGSQKAGSAVNVRLEVPTHYQGQGAFLADLAQPLKAAFGVTGS